VHDLFSGALFARHPLGREIAGSQDSIGAVTRDQIAAYHADHYQPSNVVVAVAGNVDHDEVVKRVADAQPTDGRPRPARAGGADTADADRFARVDRPLEQSHVVIGARALRRDDPDRFALAVVDQVLGGGMSSRLFQEVREKRGLAYSVFSYRSAFEETGSLAVYCATAPERVDETLDVVRGELDRLVADGGVSDRELVSAKGHLTGSLALSLESSSSRMHRIGRSELTMGEIPSLDWVVEQVDAVTAADVARVIDRVLGTGSRTLAVVGPADALVAV
jgi:predicted Zn-dependent peptidase